MQSRRLENGYPMQAAAETGLFWSPGSETVRPRAVASIACSHPARRRHSLSQCNLWRASMPAAAPGETGQTLCAWSLHRTNSPGPGPQSFLIKHFIFSVSCVAQRAQVLVLRNTQQLVRGWAKTNLHKASLIIDTPVSPDARPSLVPPWPVPSSPHPPRGEGGAETPAAICYHKSNAEGAPPSRRLLLDVTWEQHGGEKLGEKPGHVSKPTSGGGRSEGAHI
ncbi:hypothetical protein B0T18DRAFT_91947 [Schizothecium vesticola]|uniref:Uncharacterized protein n=1 Tax=Schizothecium vesticola TaxID=314040 RepID=A0AA40F7A4_9PEZI|nr:hypothetical protein B0T18DRAFT_91947 [Schizothecium vesticola]